MITFLRAFPLAMLASATLLAQDDAPPAVTDLTIVEHPSQEELEAGFARWAERHPNAFSFEPRGTTLEGRPILMGRITDARVPDEDKQIALLTSAHGAKEMNAVTGLLRFMKWLLGDDVEATEIRRRQIVLFVPYTDPDYIARGDFAESRPICGGWAAPGLRLWSVEGVARPERHPEAAAVQGIMDEFRPELHIDYHGFNHAERTMWDSTGVSWASAVSRPFLHEVAAKIDAAAEAQGFLITRGEQDDGKIRTTSPVEGFPDYTFYLRNAYPIFTLYPYCRYHTLVSLAAWGRNANERRRSRLELWQKLPHLYYGTAAPTPARDTLMGYVSTRGAQKNTATNRRVDKVIENLEGNPQFDIEGLKSAAARFPYRAFGGPRPERKVQEGALDEGSIEHGLVIRLLVPYGDATITEVRLDGHLIEKSETDGYHLTRGPGVIVEVAIPPGKVKELHIVFCHYDTPTRRRAGFGAEDW